MSYSAAAIRSAISDVLEGAHGTVRTLTVGVFGSDVFDGQHGSTQKAKTLQVTHGFDVQIGRLTSHEASPVGAIGSYRIAQADIVVDVVTKLATVVELDRRDTALAAVLSDLEQGAQALGFPGNLTTNAAATATGIVSGMLLGPGGEGAPTVDQLSEDWAKQEIRCRISATALINITQSVS